MWEQDLWRGKAEGQQWVTGDETGLNLQDNGHFSTCGTERRKSRMGAASRVNVRDEGDPVGHEEFSE